MAFAVGLRPNGLDVFGLDPCWYYGFGGFGRRASWHASNKPLTGKDAEFEASKMIGALTRAEFARLLQRQADGRVNRVFAGELPSRSNPSRVGDDEAGTSSKRKRAIVKGGQIQTRCSTKAVIESDGEEEEDDADVGSEEDASHGYTPSPTPAKSDAGLHVSPTRPQDIVVANTLLAIFSTAAKPMMAVRRKRKKGKVVQVGHGFSDSEGSDGTPTSPVLQRAEFRGRRMSPPPASDAEAATGGSASAPAAGTNLAEGERIVVVPSPIRQREGKAPVVEGSVSDVTLTAPHFVPADFAPRPEIIPFVDGVCQVIAPTKGLGLFTELNEFGESCAAVESLFVRGLAAHLSAKKSALERLDGYRLRLQKSEEDLRHKEDERCVVAETLKKANAENRSLRFDLEAARERNAERDRQLASAEEKIKSLEARVASTEATAATLAPATESAKEACYTLRLALNDLGARAEDAPGEGGTALDFSEWTQEAAGSVVEVAGAYGDCCARVSSGFVLNLLHAHGCDHIQKFPDFVKEEWPSNTQYSGAAVRAFRKGFWEDGGRDCAKNLERIARNEEGAAANSEKDVQPSGRSPGHEGEGNGGQDHPEVWGPSPSSAVAAKTILKLRSPTKLIDMPGQWAHERKHRAEPMLGHLLGHCSVLDRLKAASCCSGGPLVHDT
uniref:Uncharacterized protein n=1 Tax=Oryza glumipatula TaxID=40148 RepID=A0A0D9ZIK1_9ORYZ